MNVTFNQFFEALSDAFVLSDNNRDLLIAVYDMPDHSTTAERLAVVRQYADSASAEGQFGLVGLRIGEKLGVEPDTENDVTLWWTVIATGSHTEDGLVWTLKSELIHAMIQVGWIE